MKTSAFAIFAAVAISAVASQPLQHIQRRAVDGSVVETLVARTEPAKKPVQVKPQHDRIIVDKTKEPTDSGIVIPDAATEKPQTGKVKAKGQGRIR